MLFMIYAHIIVTPILNDVGLGLTYEVMLIGYPYVTGK